MFMVLLKCYLHIDQNICFHEVPDPCIVNEAALDGYSFTECIIYIIINFDYILIKNYKLKSKDWLFI